MSPRTLLVALAPAAIAAALWAAPASAQSAGPAITVSKTTGVDAAGERLTVTGSGYAPGQGLYIQFCQQPAGTLGTAGGRAAACNPDQGNDHTLWKTPIAGDGTFTVELAVQSGWTGTDCTTGSTTCGVFTRRDHMGGATDYSQDAFVAVAFAAAAAPVPQPAPAPTDTTPTTVAAVAAAAAPRLAETGTGSGLLAVIGIGAAASGAALVTATRRRPIR